MNFHNRSILFPGVFLYLLLIASVAMVVPQATIALLQETSSDHTLAPRSKLPHMEEFLEELAKEDPWFAPIAMAILAAEEKYPAMDQTRARLEAIQARGIEVLSPSDTGFRWQRIFHTQGTDYFDFEIDEDRFTVAYTGQKLQLLDSDQFRAAWDAFDPKDPTHVRVRLTDKRTRIAQELATRRRASRLLVRESIRQGSFFAVRFPVDKKTGELKKSAVSDILSGTKAQIAQNFGRFIIEAHPEDIKRMENILGDRKNIARLRKALHGLFNAAQTLHRNGQEGVEEIRFGILWGTEGTAPLMFTRTEEGEPINILAHAGERKKTMYFDLEALEFYQQYKGPAAGKEKVRVHPLEAIVRTQNAQWAGREHPLSKDEQRALIRIEEEFLAQRKPLEARTLATFRNSLQDAIAKVREKGDEDTRKIKKAIEQQLVQAIPAEYRKGIGGALQVQWHLLQRTETEKGPLDHYLFSAFGKRFYLVHDLTTNQIHYRFTLLEQLHAQLQDLVSLATGRLIETPDNGDDWEALLGRIRHLYAEHKARLTRIGRQDIVDLLHYVMQLDPRDGYLDEIRILAEQIGGKTGHERVVPPIFTESPLKDKEFIVMETVFLAPKQLLRVSAIRYRGMEIVETFDELVYQKDIDPKIAMRHASSPEDLKMPILPRQNEVLGRLRAFLGDTPIITHGSLSRLDELRPLMAERPLINSVVNTGQIANKLSDEYELPDEHARLTLRRLMAAEGITIPTSKMIHGKRFLRLYRLFIEQIALRTKLRAKRDHSSTLYSRLRAEIAPPQQDELRSRLDLLRRQYPQITGTKTWKVIEGAILGGGIELLALDFDDAIATSKGWPGSDSWFRREIQFAEDYGGAKNFTHLLNRVNKFLTRLGFFELTEPGIPELIQLARTNGIKVIILTARGPWPGHQRFLEKALAKLGIPMSTEDMVLTGKDDGKADKVGGLKGYLENFTDSDGANFKEKHGRYPRVAYIDDGLHHIEKVLKDNDLRPSVKMAAWYDKESARSIEFNAYQYLEKGKELLAKGEEEAFGYLFNAFGIAYDQASRPEIVQIAAELLDIMPPYTSAPNTNPSDFVRWFIAFTLQDPPLKREVLLHELRKQEAITDRPTIYFAPMIASIQEWYFRPVIEDAPDEKTRATVGLTLEDARHHTRSNSRFARTRTIIEIPDPEGPIGIQILSRREPIGDFPGPPGSVRQYEGGTNAIRRKIFQRFQDILPNTFDTSDFRTLLASLRSDIIRDVYDHLSKLPSDSTPAALIGAIRNTLADDIPTSSIQERSLQDILSATQALELAA